MNARSWLRVKIGRNVGGLMSHLKKHLACDLWRGPWGDRDVWQVTMWAWTLT